MCKRREGRVNLQNECKVKTNSLINKKIERLFFDFRHIFFDFGRGEGKNCSSMPPQVACPCHQRAVAQVVSVVLVGIRLTLETDAVISPFHLETALHQPHQKLHSIPQKEQYKAHLQLLAGVDEFVVQFVKCHASPPLLHEDDAEEVEPVVTPEGDESVVDHFHGGKGSDFFPNHPPKCSTSCGNPFLRI